MFMFTEVGKGFTELYLYSIVQMLLSKFENVNIL